MKTIKAITLGLSIAYLGTFGLAAVIGVFT